MQDVYIAPAQRQKGYARMLIGALARIGQENEWGRIYWLAEAGNEAAQALYKDIGVKLDFTFHILPLR